MPSVIRISVLVTVLWLCSSFAANGGSGEFRIETATYHSGDATNPPSKNLTLFSDGVVYDFPLSNSIGITVFEPTGQRLTMLDAKNQWKTFLDVKELERVAEKLKTVRLPMPPLIREMVFPQFQEIYTSQSQMVELRGEMIHYRVRCVEFMDGSFAAQYRDFANAYACLNYYLFKRPPHARLKLNEVLAKRQLIPLSVELTVNSAKRDRRKIRTKHKVERSLTSGDVERIDLAQSCSKCFQEVSLRTYLSIQR